MLFPIDAAKVAGLSFALETDKLKHGRGNEAHEIAGRAVMKLSVFDLAENLRQTRQKLFHFEALQQLLIDEGQVVRGKGRLAIVGETGNGGLPGSGQIVDVILETLTTE